MSVLELINGFHATMIVIAAQRLDVFATIDRAPVDAPQLAGALAANEAMLKRLLNGLEAISLIARDADGTYQLTAEGRMFTRGPTAAALTAWVKLVEAQYLPAWGRMADGVASGDVAFELAFGMRAWEHRAKQPELNEAFQRVMESEEVRLIPETAAAIAALAPFADARCVVDVGGGTGKLLAEILHQHAGGRGVLFDQPHVVREPCPELVAARGRFEVAGGSFFDEVPRGGDVYVLKHVLHNWDDEACGRILAACRRAMTGGAKLVVVESILPDTELHAARNLVMLDLHMMCLHRGRERTRSEYAALFAAAGCRIERVFPRTEAHPDVIVATEGEHA